MFFEAFENLYNQYSSEFWISYFIDQLWLGYLYLYELENNNKIQTFGEDKGYVFIPVIQEQMINKMLQLYQKLLNDGIGIATLLLLFIFLWLKKNKTDLVVLDLHMPGIDGFELYKKIKIVEGSDGPRTTDPRVLLALWL